VIIVVQLYRPTLDIEHPAQTISQTCLPNPTYTRSLSLQKLRIPSQSNKRTTTAHPAALWVCPRLDHLSRMDKIGDCLYRECHIHRSRYLQLCFGHVTAPRARDGDHEKRLASDNASSKAWNLWSEQCASWTGSLPIGELKEHRALVWKARNVYIIGYKLRGCQIRGQETRNQDWMYYTKQWAVLLPIERLAPCCDTSYAYAYSHGVTGLEETR
jgi:hypothetical protein